MTYSPAGPSAEAPVTRRLDWWVVAASVLVTAAVAVPPIAVVSLLAAGKGGSDLWVVPVLALFAGFVLGGRHAGRRRPDAPVLHSAAAGTAAFAVFSMYVTGRRLVTGRGLSAELVVTLGVLLQITVALAAVAGYLASRRVR